MRRRLALWFALVILVLFGGLSLTALVGFEPSPARDGIVVLIGLFGVAGSALAHALGVLLTRHFTRTVAELADAVARVGEAGDEPRLVATGDSELVLLAETFNATSERLAERIARLERDREQLRTVLSGMVEGVVALDG